MTFYLPGPLAASRRRSAPAGNAYASAVLADSPLLYLRLEETSGATCANTGSLAGSATCNGTFTRNVTSATATLGVAVTLEGVGDDDYIAYADDPALDLTGDFTYELWVKSAGYVSGNYLVSKGRDGSTTAGYALFVPGVSGSAGGLGIRVSTSTVLSTATNDVLSTGAWHHAVATRVGTTFTLYVDGASVATTTSSSTPQATAKPLLVGIQQTEFGFQGGLAGSVDEVAVYNTGLSSTRVSAHYAART